MKAKILLLAAILLSGTILLCATHARAHDWYTYRTDPVTGSRCCGGSDCKPVPLEAKWIARTPQGLHVVMSLAETQLINKSSTAPINEVVPWTRVQEATIDDHDNIVLYYLCVTPYREQDYQGRTNTRLYCVFQNGSAT